MNLPNFFLADIPPEATLSANVIGEACMALKRNRENYLAARPAQSIIQTLHTVGENWLDPEYPFRKMAMEQGPQATGFSEATLAHGIDSFFSQLNGDNIQALVAQELGHEQRLDLFVSTPGEQRAMRSAIANGPVLLAHITAGNLPCPAWMSMTLGLMTRSAQFVKCASGGALLPRLFAHSVYEVEPKIGACMEVAEWKGGRTDIEEVLFAQADCLTATGSDETLADIRRRLPSDTRFLAYGHRVSFIYVTRDILSGYTLKKVITNAVSDIVAWNQQGCLSPHVIYVQQGGPVSGEHFADLLATELARREEKEPRGPVSHETAAIITTRRHFYEVRALHSTDTRLWCSENSTAWTVVYENDPHFQLSCLNRFIYVKETSDLGEALRHSEGVRGKVSTVGLAATNMESQSLAIQLARWGATRVCPVGQMQNPPLAWRHDGRPSLADLVQWTDWEQ